MNDAEFTEHSYTRLLDMAAARYRFCDYAEMVEGPHLIWRHDIDYSPHRALPMAKLEAARGLRCVYHILPTSRYYSMLELETAEILKRIKDLGHDIGLHFDMDIFGEAATLDPQVVEQRISFERSIIETTLDISIQSLSFHNYTLNASRLLQADRICGMVNAISPRIQREYKYVSDSNGFWRHESLADVLTEGAAPRLHVLTHPVWWTTEPMKPYERFRRAVLGRAQSNLELYVATMKRDGRLHSIADNIGLPADAGDDLTDY